MAIAGQIMPTLVPEVRLIRRPDAARTTNHQGGFLCAIYGVLRVLEYYSIYPLLCTDTRTRTSQYVSVVRKKHARTRHRLKYGPALTRFDIYTQIALPEKGPYQRAKCPWRWHIPLPVTRDGPGVDITGHTIHIQLPWQHTRPPMAGILPVALTCGISSIDKRRIRWGDRGVEALPRRIGAAIAASPTIQPPGEKGSALLYYVVRGR
jgi:hypothetical protein